MDDCENSVNEDDKKDLDTCLGRPSSPVPALLSDSGNIIDTENDLYKGLSALINNTSSLTDGSKMAISMEDYLLADSVEESGIETDLAPLLKDLTSESGMEVTSSDLQDLRSSEETGDDKNVNVASLVSEVLMNAADEVNENPEQASDEEKKNSLDAMLFSNVDAENKKDDPEEEKNDIDETLAANPAAEDGKNAESVDKIQSESSAVQNRSEYREQKKRKHYDDFAKPAPVSTKNKNKKKSNKLIILFANKLCKKLRLPHQHKEIRSELRGLGRFLEAIRKIEPNITDMASVFNPAYYNAAVDAVIVIAELDSKSQLYNAPTVASGMGTTLKKLGHLMEAECIKNHDVEKKRNAKDFLKLHLDDYGTSVNRGVAETMAKMRRTKKVTLPKNDDIRQQLSR